RLSSCATASPGFLNQVATVASVTVSPSAGTRTSLLILLSFDGQRFVHERFLFSFVLGREAGGGRGRGGASDIDGAGVLGADAVQHPLDIGLDEGPAALVLRLFLAPDDLRILEALQLLDHRHGREGV